MMARRYHGYRVVAFSTERLTSGMVDVQSSARLQSLRFGGGYDLCCHEVEGDEVAVHDR